LTSYNEDSFYTEHILTNVTGLSLSSKRLLKNC